MLELIKTMVHQNYYRVCFTEVSWCNRVSMIRVQLICTRVKLSTNGGSSVVG